MSNKDGLREALIKIRDEGEKTIDAGPGNPRDGQYKGHAYSAQGHHNCHRIAADALSRAPQPDTVTDAMVEAALQGFDTGTGDPNDYRTRIRAALTAALNTMKGQI